MYMKAMIAVFLISTSSVGCVLKTTELIYDTRELFQCEEATNISPSQSAKILTGAGIEVLASSCGTKTGILLIAMCGAPSLSIIVHEIHAENIQYAEPLGFSKVDTLIDASRGIGYELIDCEDV